MKAINQNHEIRKSSAVNNDWKYLFCFPCKFSGTTTNKAPDANSLVVILQKDVEEEFGARLVTYKARKRGGPRYYRHYLNNVLVNGPAGEMKIEDGDEILFLNEDFTQGITHEELLNLFRNVKVDGRTRFALVIRRCHKKRLRDIWSWIETSATLAPDTHTHPVHDDHPKAEDTEYRRVENNKVEIKTTHRYKISGTQLYLDIQNRKVTADVYKGTETDKTKTICKRQRYWQDNDGQVHFEAALCDENLENYIAVGPSKEIITKSEPEWFDQTERGSDVLFRFQDIYLGYNHERDQVDAQTSEFVFEEFPGDIELYAPLPDRKLVLESAHSSWTCSPIVLMSPHEQECQLGSMPSSNDSRSNGYLSNSCTVVDKSDFPLHYTYSFRETAV